MQAKISIICNIGMVNITYVIIQVNRSQLRCSFISSWNQVKNTTNPSGMIKPKLTCSVHSWLQLQLCQIQKFKPYDFVNADQNSTKEQHFSCNTSYLFFFLVIWSHGKSNCAIFLQWNLQGPIYLQQHSDPRNSD